MKALPVNLFSFVANLFYDEKIMGAIRSLIAPAPGLKLLDVPCGSGVLFNICSPCEYYGVDVDEARVVEAANLYPSGKFSKGDASRLEFPESNFDIILAAGLFHHVDDDLAAKIVDEFHRVLKPEGRVVVFEAIWPRNPLNVAGLLARKMDQGDYVRHPEEYMPFFERKFSVESKDYPSKLCLDYLLVTLAPK